MKELLKQLEAAEAETNRLEKEFEESIEEGRFKEEIEKAYDEAYKKEFDLYISLAKEIVKQSKEEISFDIAKKLIKEKRSELKALLQRAA